MPSEFDLGWDAAIIAYWTRGPFVPPLTTQARANHTPEWIAGYEDFLATV